MNTARIQVQFFHLHQDRAEGSRLQWEFLDGKQQEAEEACHRTGIIQTLLLCRAGFI